MPYKSNKYATINLAAVQTTFLANTTKYLGNVSAAVMGGGGGYQKIYAIRPMHIKAIEIFTVADNNPTTENITVNIRKNDTTNTLVGTFNYTGASQFLRIYNNNLNISLAAGDYFEILIATAAVFVTPPTNCRAGGYVVCDLGA